MKYILQFITAFILNIVNHIAKRIIDNLFFKDGK